MSTFAFPALFAFLVNLGIGLYVLGFGRGRMMDRLFGLLILMISAWNLGDLVMLNAASNKVAELGARLGSSSIMVPIIYFLFASTMSDWSQGKNRIKLWMLLSLPGFVFYGIVLAWFPRFFQVQFLDYFGVYYYGLAQGHDAIAYHLLLFAFGLSYIVGGFITLTFALRTSRKKRIRRQIRMVLILTVSFAILSMIISLSLLAAGDWGLVSMSLLTARDWALALGLFTRLVLSSLLASVLLRYRLSDFFRLAERGFVLSFLTAAVMAIYVLVIKQLGEGLGAVAGEQSLLLESALIVALVFAFHPLRIWIERSVDRLFIGERPDLKALFMQYSSDIQRTDNFRDLAEITISCINKGIRCEGSSLLLYNHEDGKFLDIMNHLNQLVLVVEKGVNGFTISHDDFDIDDVKPSDHASATEMKRSPTDVMLVRGMASIEGLLALFRNADSKPLMPAEHDFIRAVCDAAGSSITTIKALEALEKRNRQLRQTEKLAALGKLSAGLAHEIRNPLNVISGAAQTIMASGDNSDIRKELSGYIKEEVIRLSTLLSDFLRFAKPSPPQKQLCDISSIAEEVAGMVKKNSSNKGIKLKTIIKPASTNADPAQIKQVLLNLLLNAIEATPSNESIILETFSSTDKAFLRVIDTGCGMTEDIVERVFDPFFTNREDGTGLGLSIVHRIIKDHDGIIEIKTSPGKGTGVYITLPMEEKSA